VENAKKGRFKIIRHRFLDVIALHSQPGDGRSKLSCIAERTMSALGADPSISVAEPLVTNGEGSGHKGLFGLAHLRALLRLRPRTYTSTVLGQQYSQRIAPALKRDIPLVPSRRNRTLGRRFRTCFGTFRLVAVGFRPTVPTAPRGPTSRNRMGPPGGPLGPSTPKSAPAQSWQMAIGVSSGLFCVVFQPSWSSMSKNRSKYGAYERPTRILGSQFWKWGERDSGPDERAVYPARGVTNTMIAKEYRDIRLR
jgi:hypothetical protein